MAELVETYVKRASQTGKQAGITSVNVIDFTESRKQTAQARALEEADILISTCPAGAVMIALDEKGKSVSSADFARIMKEELESGTQNLVFVIGGPDGHGPEIRNNARHILCFGKMTWPHMLARVLLAEQIYRVVTILVNHPYHRE